jgi:Domain of unknown function (DUF4157)
MKQIAGNPGAKTKGHTSISRKESGNSFFYSHLVQPKLAINHPGDAFEREADSTANKVVQRLSDPFFNSSRLKNSTTPFFTKNNSSIFRKAVFESNDEDKIQRKCAHCEEEEKLQRKEMESGETAPSSTLQDKLFSSGNGYALPKETNLTMSRAFGADFTDVRVHTDSEAVQMNKQIHAQAFTHGSDIYFNKGKYQPESLGGKNLLAHELTHVLQQSKMPGSQISRKMSVEKPDINIPNPGGNGLVQTNVVTVLDYVSKLCPDTAFMASGGEIIIVDASFCSPSVKQPDGTFKRGSEVSAHPVSCECLCDMIMNPLLQITVRISDTTGADTNLNNITKPVITVPSPNGKPVPVRGKSGKTIASPPFIIFGHELCGHLFLALSGSNEKRNTQNIDRGGHDPAIKRENLMRKEHGLALRGTFRDPCCGLSLSTSVDLAKPTGKCGDDFEKAKNKKGTAANECKHWRDEYNKLNGTNFTTDDVIPVKKGEKIPARWRIEIAFKKDRPQAWNTLEQSLTPDGKDAFEVVRFLISDETETQVQLSGNASSDKPANDPDYNKRLTKRRVQMIQKELLKKGIGKKRFQSFDSDCEKLEEGIHNCGDEVSEKQTNEMDRNVEAKLFVP